MRAFLIVLGWLGLLLLALFIMFCALFFIVEYIPGDSLVNNILVVYVENGDTGEPYRGTIEAVSAHRDYGRSSGAQESLACYRYTYYNDAVTIFEIRDINGKLVSVIPAHDVSSRGRITVDPVTGGFTNGIRFRDYFFNINKTHHGEWVIVTFVCLFITVMAILVAISFVLMLISPYKTRQWGVRRCFSGSIPHFLFCLLVVGAMVYVFITKREMVDEIFTKYDRAFTSFIFVYIAGTLLYPFAHRNYQGAEMREQRARQLSEDYDNANTFDYSVTKWSDNTTSSNYTEKKIGRNVGMLIVWVIKMVFAPIVVYFALIKNYMYYWRPPQD